MTIEIQNLTKSYSQGALKVPVLRGINLRIETGEIVALVGQSGSGKSTLLSILSGLESADSGSVIFAGQNLLSLSPKESTQFRAKNISIVFQQFYLFSHLTALENVMLPLEIQGFDRNARTNSHQMLKEVLLADRTDHLPGAMSGGECQRVAIARALITNPTLCLADEPSGNLDEETGRIVMDVFFAVARAHRTTCLLVTHNRDLADRCDRTLTLKAGVVN